MPIILDHQLREQIPHKTTEFPVTYYHDELEELPNWAGPYHWHPNFEIATAERSGLDYQVGQHICQRQYVAQSQTVVRQPPRSGTNYPLFRCCHCS